jgi:hypothetical protein
MKKEWADKWISALKSGKFKQSFGVLSNNEGYCCLGVLCKIVDDNRRFKPHETHPDRNTMSIVGLKNMGGYFGDNEDIDKDKYLTNLNDSGKTFEEIAEIIENNWEAL